MNLDDWQIAGLKKLRAPFPAHQISKLPKPTKAQTDAVRADFKAGIRCTLCGAWHHKDVIHLDYVGHAALTDRLLDADPGWNWEPLALDDNGLPRLDETGGLWIKLTVCGVTRLGYGHADAKPNADAGARLKEVIGDAIRNSGMRFGAALDLWHKGDLHGPEGSDEAPTPDPAEQAMLATLDPAERKMLTELYAAAGNGTRALGIAFAAIPTSPAKARVWTQHQARLKSLAAEVDTIASAQPAQQAPQEPQA